MFLSFYIPWRKFNFEAVQTTKLISSRFAEKSKEPLFHEERRNERREKKRNIFEKKKKSCCSIQQKIRWSSPLLFLGWKLEGRGHHSHSLRIWRPLEAAPLHFPKSKLLLPYSSNYTHLQNTANTENNTANESCD